MSAMASASSSSWSIAIKTVGSRITANKATTTNNINILHNNSINHHDNNDDNGGGGSSQNYTSPSSSSTGESTSFTLQVHPNDPLHSLSTKIESITGLSPTEQRLIYRGRIISVPPPPPTNDTETTTTTSSSTTIQDIHGLSDGETIHLVPRLAEDAIPILPRRDSSSISSTNAIAANNNNFGRRNSSNTTNNDNNTEAEEADGIANALMGGLLSGFNGNYPTEDIVGSGGLFSGANGGGGANNVTSLSGSDGMSLLAALLGLGSAVDGSGSGGTANDNNNNQQQQQQRQGAGVAGNAQGLGGVVSRAAMMGVLDDGSSTTTTNMTTTTAAAAVPASSLDSLVAAAVRAAATGGGAETTTTAQPRTTAGLFNRSADEIRSSRNAATANPFNPNNNNNANTATTTATGAPSSSSAIRAARNRRRATAARLTASDIRIPDPGSMEPVRQGLMTLHTLLGNAELGLNDQHQRQQRIHEHRQEVDGEEKGEEELTDNFGGQSQQRNQLDHHPLNSHRQWYRGQWLDALDTVNQWLEATIVDIVLPSDLLGNWAVSRSSHDGMRQRRTMYHNNTSQQQQRPVEAVVSGNDLEGRRRLLLEPRPSDEDDDNNVMSYLNEGFRPRDDNDGVQLLLIHYNGWPHRWDEWIRSDSPRIRPFRTRTRHRIMSTHASPTPQAVFQAAPSTFIRDESDEVERAMLLPELQRVIASVNNVLSSVLPLEEEEGEGRTGMTTSSSSSSLENDSSSAVDSSHLPWRLPNHGSEYFQSAAANNDDDDNGNSDDNSDDGYYNNSTSSSRRQRPDPRSQLNAAQLRQLAPLIDRLGRTLTDAAPHIASLADTLPRRPSPLPQARPVPRTDQVGDGSESFAAQASRLYFGINSEDDHDGRSESASSTATADAQVAEVETPVDPDLTDFVNGMVNTTRGGSSRDTNREPISSNLLASYLSSIGAGGGALTAGGGDNNDAPRVVRVGGGDGALFGAGGGAGPGIDIHIHAIVTGPGMTPTGLGGLGIGGGGTPVNRNANVSAPVTATPVQQQSSGGGIDGDEIDHLFSDLYSESPPPVNLHQNHRNNDAISGNRDNLSQIFEECRSIEEESDSSIDSAATQPFDGKVVASTHEDVVSAVEEGAISADSEVVNESNDASNDSTTVGTASSPDTRPPPPAADRRRSSSSFGSRMYRRTFGRLNGSSRRFSGS